MLRRGWRLLASCVVLCLLGTFIASGGASPVAPKLPRDSSKDSSDELDDGSRYFPPGSKCNCRCSNRSPFWAVDQVHGDRIKFRSKCQLSCWNCLFDMHFVQEISTPHLGFGKGLQPRVLLSPKSKPKSSGSPRAMPKPKPQAKGEAKGRCDADCYNKPGPAVCAVHKYDETDKAIFMNMCHLELHNCLYGQKYVPAKEYDACDS